MGRTLAAVLALALAAPLLFTPAAAEPTSVVPVVYQPPVAGPIIDPYRPPSSPYGPGNRGVDYATTPGEVVGAAADGVVTFAGAVGGGLHVVVLHADGVRTSLSFLGGVLAARGEQVRRGQPVGRAATSLHFGARRGEAYLDPTSLFRDAPPVGTRSVLVPDGPDHPLGVDAEAAGLHRLLAGAAARSSPPAAGELTRAAGGTGSSLGPTTEPLTEAVIVMVGPTDR